jgi:hypothetical protein
LRYCKPCLYMKCSECHFVNFFYVSTFTFTNKSSPKLYRLKLAHRDRDRKKMEIAAQGWKQSKFEIDYICVCFLVDGYKYECRWYTWRNLKQNQCSTDTNIKQIVNRYKFKLSLIHYGYEITNCIANKYKHIIRTSIIIINYYPIRSGTKHINISSIFTPNVAINEYGVQK